MDVRITSWISLCLLSNILETSENFSSITCKISFVTMWRKKRMRRKIVIKNDCLFCKRNLVKSYENNPTKWITSQLFYHSDLHHLITLLKLLFCMLIWRFRWRYFLFVFVEWIIKLRFDLDLLIILILFLLINNKSKHLFYSSIESINDTPKLFGRNCIQDSHSID